MGLTTRGRGRGRGNPCNITQRGGIIQNPLGGIYSPVGFHTQTSPGAPSFFNVPVNRNFAPSKRGFGKFPRHRQNYFNKNFVPRDNARALEIDLTKPWVTDDIKNEEINKQELFKLWNVTKSNENWAKYEAQKLAVQSLYDKARADYVEKHPNEAVHWGKSCTNKQYFCETCDKSFRTENDLLVHESEHETCGREGCEFTAHPKIIAKHIKMQHESGLYKRIGKLYTDEDITKWIEERKKRYPTRKVVEEKKILEQEKIKRGERIKESDSKFNKSFTNKGRFNGKKNFEKKSTRNRKKKKKVSVALEKCIEEETSIIRKGIPAFLGTKTVSEPVAPEKNDFNISDEEWETGSKPPIDKKPLLNSSLGLLATFYDSEEEEVDDNNKDIQTEIKAEIMSADEGSGPEEASSKNPVQEPIDDDKVPHKRKFVREKEQQDRKRRNTSNDYNVEKRSLTLLEKLLKNEIRHERNVILQCVHYVVKNNFFKS